jgi:hypothetical protein
VPYIAGAFNGSRMCVWRQYSLVQSLVFFFLRKESCVFRSLQVMEFHPYGSGDPCRFTTKNHGKISENQKNIEFRIYKKMHMDMHTESNRKAYGCVYSICMCCYHCLIKTSQEDKHASIFTFKERECE